MLMPGIARPPLPDHPSVLKLTVEVEGLRADCLGCSGITDSVIEAGKRGDLDELAECVKDLSYHHRWDCKP